MRKLDTRYNLINCGDVIEHFEKKDGEELVKLCVEKSDYVLITIPIGKHWEQRESSGNQYEAHKSVWYNNDFTKYRYNKIKSFTDFMMRDYSVVLLSKQKFRFTKKHGKYFGIKNFLKYKLGLRRLLEKFGK
jgi:predicted SAM-dependent methyltransferase